MCQLRACGHVTEAATGTFSSMGTQASFPSMAVPLLPAWGLAQEGSQQTLLGLPLWPSG